MSQANVTTFSKVGELFCRCEWKEEEEMVLTVLHSDKAWTARLVKESLDLGARAGDQVRYFLLLKVIRSILVLHFSMLCTFHLITGKNISNNISCIRIRL